MGTTNKELGISYTAGNGARFLSMKLSKCYNNQNKVMLFLV